MNKIRFNEKPNITTGIITFFGDDEWNHSNLFSFWRRYLRWLYIWWGGYSSAILKFTKTKVIAIDRDASVKEIARRLEKKFNKRFQFSQIKFSQMDKLLRKNVDVIIFDLGLSSIQLNNLERGFSFKSEDSLDMTMGLSDLSAEEAVNNLSESQLRSVLKILGEEKEATNIARNIVKTRSKKNY